MRPVPLILDENLYFKAICNEFGHLFDQPEFSDVELEYRGLRIFAHRAVLSSRSEYFQAMFSSGMIDSTSKVIEISGEDWLDENLFKEFIRLLYCYDMAHITDMEGSLCTLLCAVRFEAPVLKDMMQCHASKYVTDENVQEVIDAIGGTNCSLLEPFLASYTSNIQRSQRHL